jgi:hypothetical protein
MPTNENGDSKLESGRQSKPEIISNVHTILDDLSEYIINNGGNINKPINMYDFECKFTESINKISDKVSDLFGQSLSTIDESAIIKYFKNKYSDLGIRLRTNRKYKRSIITLNGEITYDRYVLRPTMKNDLDKLLDLENKTTVIPLDEWLNIANLPFKITPVTMIEIAWYAAYQLSYYSAAEMISKSLKIYISQETVRLVADYIGNLVFENDKQIAENLYNEMSTGKLEINGEKKQFILYLMVDGSMIHTREKNDDGNKWQENKLGLIFSSDNMVLKSKESEGFNYKIIKKEYVNYFGSVEDFQKLFFAGSLRNGYGKCGKTVLISDGATWISNMKKLLFPDAIHILDFWHLCEYVYDFAKLYFNHDESKYEPWVESIKEKLLISNYNEVVNEVVKMETNLKKRAKNGITKEDQKKIEKLSNYILSHIENIDYLSYRSQGLYIGSGHIESGNKSVAQERLKRPGMMWNINSAQHLLMLRAKLKSDLWQSDVTDVVLKYFNQV